MVSIVGWTQSTCMLAVMVCVMCLVGHAWGHSCLTDPPARLAATGGYSNMCSATYYDTSSGNCNGGGGVGCRSTALNADTSVCGGPFQDSPWNPRDLAHSSQKTYTSGSAIDLTVYYRVVHTSSQTPGWVEANLCTDGDSLTKSCFDANPLEAIGGSSTYRHTVPNSQQPWTTAVYTFELPAGVSCSKCTIQYIWQTSSWDGSTGEQFQNCADITISGGGGGGPSPNPPSNPPSNPPPSPPSGSPTGGSCDVNSVCGTAGAQPAPCACSADCSSFVNCAHGSGTLQACGSGLVFNPAGYCDWDYNYSCPC